MLIDAPNISKSLLILMRILSFLLCVPTQVVVSWRVMRIQLKIIKGKLELLTCPNTGQIIQILELTKQEQEFQKILLRHKKTDVTVEISVQGVLGNIFNNK